MANSPDESRKIWQRKLIEALHPPGPKDKEVIALDGGNFCYFSMPLKGHGFVTVKGEPVETASPVMRMVLLAYTLEYATGKGSVRGLERAVARLE